MRQSRNALPCHTVDTPPETVQLYVRLSPSHPQLEFTAVIPIPRESHGLAKKLLISACKRSIHDSMTVLHYVKTTLIYNYFAPDCCANFTFSH